MSAALDHADDHADDHAEELDRPTCAICLAPYRGRVYLSPCFHSFCATCLVAWLDISVRCPLCKAEPDKLHWGVDTDLGVLNTIELANLSRSTISKKAAWMAALRQAARSAEEQEFNSAHLNNYTEERRGHETSEHDSSTQYSEQRGHMESNPSQSRPRTRSRSCSTSSSRCSSLTRSRSRSVTPIDSYHHQYDSSEIYSMSASDLQQQPQVDTIGLGDATAPGEPLCPPDRKMIYVLGMEPSPAEAFPLANQILPSDMTFLAPFLEQDLAILTESCPEPVDPIILAHISSVIQRHGADSISVSPQSTRGQGHGHGPRGNGREGLWDVIEQEVLQWITLTPGPGMTERLMAWLFVREMRRIARRRWRIGNWNSHVKYVPLVAPDIHGGSRTVQ